MNSAVYATDRCLSVTSWCSIETDECIELIFGTEATLALSHTALYGNSGISTTRAVSSRTFPQTPKIADYSVVFATARRTSLLSSIVARLSHWASTVVYNTWLWCRRRAVPLRRPRYVRIPPSSR